MNDLTNNVPRKHKEDLDVWYKRCQAYYQEHWSQKEAKFREDLKNGPQRRYCASVMEEVKVISAFEDTSDLASQVLLGFIVMSF